MLIVGRFTADELFEQNLVRHLLLVSIFIFAVAFVSSDSVFGHVTCLGRWKRDSWRIVGWIGQYFKCRNWNFNVAKKTSAKKSLPNIFWRNKSTQKSEKNSSANKLVETNLTKHIWKNYKKITEGESLPNNPWRKIRTRKLWREIFAKKSLPINFWSNKSTKKSLKKHLHQQICWRKTSNKKLLQRNFYPKILKSTFLPKKKRRKTSTRFWRETSTIKSLQKNLWHGFFFPKIKKNTNKIWRKIHT